MPVIRDKKHSALYYRNLLIVVGCFVFTFGAAVMRGLHPLSMLWFLPLLYVNYSVWLMFLTVHPPRRRPARAALTDYGIEYETVDFPSRDGLRLAGWYVPSRNRAAVVLVHPAGRTRTTMLNQARLLATEGFGVLLFDLRGHGGSEGDSINGVDEAKDVLGAVDFLRRRTDVDRERIGALGVSLGAALVLRAAAESENIHALVLESLGPMCLADHGGRPDTLWRLLNYPANWYLYTMGDFLAGKKITDGVLKLLPRLAPRPVMLIATGWSAEVYFNRRFLAVASEPKSLWVVPRAHHGVAYIVEPEAYRERVRGFFTKYLLGPI